MKNIIQTGVVILFILMTLSSCKKEEKLNANLSIIDKNIIDKTPTDLWLDENYLKPYNIETKFRYDRFELTLGKNVTPPLESQVIPAMEMVKAVWIKPFEAVGGADFIKRISPKQFILAGSAEYNSDGTITLGTAEGGRKIVLYVINSFDKTNLASVKQTIQVIQHEYTHILNQTVDYQTDFQNISKGGYVANWTQETLANGRALGFITQYARAAPEEDYAEMSSNMLMMGRVVFNAIVSTTPADGQLKLKKKEQYVVDYFKSAFNIDFYALQTEVQNALNNITAPVLAKLIGPGIGYTTLYSNPNTDISQSSEFSGLWKTASANMTASGFTVNDITMTFKAANAMTLRYSFSSGASVYQADADYTLTIDAAGIGTIKLSATQPTTATYNNMNLINPMMAPVNNYFKNNKFKIDWINKIIPGNIGGIGSLGAFYKQTDGSSYFYGAMGQ
ncbi:putative zinc-binding metallopeptidase [Pedobacter cryoconitis]|uniref:Substrate import-associated zinc metallohydrolase lipoprotein n=1 Tax=Pedobacter cryoconitis TaxID=188932 RepID=A0A7X0J788_9SPHI|nr:putative zinc-binding metallopeptidase [Pedobacter cryoconitis]MBB6502386.1 substrate import-associated zinc metallohydrolase lipoprotein [Pedobacter cryoconitis]